MKSLEEMIAEVSTTASNLGLTNVEPVVLSDAGNLTVHLHPHLIIARVAKLFPGDDSNFWREVWARELRIAQHLITNGIPIVPYSTNIPPGPHQVADTWMTLWEYVEPFSLPALRGEEAVEMVNGLAASIIDFNESLQKYYTDDSVATSGESLLNKVEAYHKSG